MLGIVVRRCVLRSLFKQLSQYPLLAGLSWRRVRPSIPRCGRPSSSAVPSSSSPRVSGVGCGVAVILARVHHCRKVTKSASSGKRRPLTRNAPCFQASSRVSACYRAQSRSRRSPRSSRYALCFIEAIHSSGILICEKNFSYLFLCFIDCM